LLFAIGLARVKMRCGKFGKLSHKPETIGLVSVKNKKYTQITQKRRDFDKDFYAWLLGPHACLGVI